MNNVKTVGNSAFKDCTRLTVTIPYEIESIGNKAFFNVKKVSGNLTGKTELVLGNGLTNVGNQAFYGAKIDGVVITKKVFHMEI